MSEETMSPDLDCAGRPLLQVGIDVGSITTKAVVLASDGNTPLFSRYKRHQAHQAQSVVDVLSEISSMFPGSHFTIAICGSGGETVARALGVCYVQEVVANSLAIRARYPQTNTAIELGGQDAKVIFFHHEGSREKPDVADMRMNGSCAGGTGAFIDEIAALLKVSADEFENLAAAGSNVFDISGRCGVYAKTDIQPLINQGACQQDIALSSFHAIAKQTIGGLAQGLSINAPVIFEGGPLTFNPTLIKVFAERLRLNDADIIVPEHPELMMALGAAYSLRTLFADEAKALDLQVHLDSLATTVAQLGNTTHKAASRYFENNEDYLRFATRHHITDVPAASYPFEADYPIPESGVIEAYLGIDSGSTTTKFALMDRSGRLVAQFYASNGGKPLEVARDALVKLHRDACAADVNLRILGLGTTGYGELLFARAFHADFHMVETVAHARAAREYEPDATFILDIGGQDMKAIWLDEGVITDIVVNEACSSGCGSFLEGFAASLHIPVDNIAEAAFRSQNPAILGSRCTVFMNSSIVSEQRDGKNPDDIMAGLCRSIIENVFTKVVRVPNFDRLGNHVVVQGGTFKNDAVLRALEQRIDRKVTRAPYPGIMGALGVCLLMRECHEAAGSPHSTFVGWDALEHFDYTTQTGIACTLCTNRCSRTVLTFPDGETWVTGNRCEKGEIADDPTNPDARKKIRQRVKAIEAANSAVPNLFAERERLLFKKWDHARIEPDRGRIVGIPRVLAFWDNAPFWSTFFESLGFTVRFSDPSTRSIYENGLSGVVSDTVCFPAKLVHGHLRNLVDSGVDFVFMPIITTVKSENSQKTSESMCAVVKGYPLVIRNSDNPTGSWGVDFQDPLFHWFCDVDRERQLIDYMQRTFGVSSDHTRAAIAEGDRSQASFRETLLASGAAVIRSARESNTYAVVLASRPYHNDDLVNHGLPEIFTKLGIPVLTPDAVPGATDVDLSHTRLDIVNNFHARMLATAIMAAGDDALEYVQLVSFGCGHDAYLSDEIVRLMKEVSGKTPLVLKVDESDIAGPLRIRVRSFLETVQARRALGPGRSPAIPKDPYPVKYQVSDRTQKVILVPNTSHAFCRLMSAVFDKQGARCVPMEMGREEAIRLGKKYVHNDICFPAQITIGEALATLESGKYDPHQVAIATGKYIGDCRLTHYGALLRKALDDAGYPYIPIITNDDKDDRNMHPGFKMNTVSAIRTAMTLPMIDVMEELLRKMRPYELEPGASEAAFEAGMDDIIDGLRTHGVGGAKRGFSCAIDRMCAVKYDRSNPRPRVLIVGEYLLNFHPGANRNIESYLESNGMEIIEARMTDVIRKTYFYKNAQVREYHVSTTLGERSWYTIANRLFEIAHDTTDRIAVKHPLYHPVMRMGELVQASDSIIHHTFDAGEGVLIPAEILHHAAQGCRAFVILQPFGCLPNHVCGRGVAKKLKALYPDAQILPLDYDPDVSFANLENRLQMLIMNSRAADEKTNANTKNFAVTTSAKMKRGNYERTRLHA